MSVLVGYARRSNAGSAIKLSINKMVFEDCEEYHTSDGQMYVSLVMSLSALQKIMNGERSVTTIISMNLDGEE